MTFSILDVVVLSQDIPEENLTAGMIGTIIDVYAKPSRAYEVEFCDSEGKTLNLLPLLPHQITAYG